MEDKCYRTHLDPIPLGQGFRQAMQIQCTAVEDDRIGGRKIGQPPAVSIPPQLGVLSAHGRIQQLDVSQRRPFGAAEGHDGGTIPVLSGKPDLLSDIVSLDDLQASRQELQSSLFRSEVAQAGTRNQVRRRRTREDVARTERAGPDSRALIS